MKTVSTKSENMKVQTSVCFLPAPYWFKYIFILRTKITQRGVQKHLIFLKRQTELQQTLIRSG